MNRRLVIVRHGNTFESGQTPTRAGARTDLPLTAAGREQARVLGVYFARHGLAPAKLLAGPLVRTRGTAALLAESLAAENPAWTPPPVVIDGRLREIDYGPDENLPEDAVEERLGRLRLGGGAATASASPSMAEIRAAGRAVLAEWNATARVPAGWLVDPEGMAATWREIAAEVLAGPDATVLAVTSNGVARFAAVLLADGPPAGGLKLATGAFSILEHDGRVWRAPVWNRRP